MGELTDELAALLDDTHSRELALAVAAAEGRPGHLSTDQLLELHDERLTEHRNAILLLAARVEELHP